MFPFLPFVIKIHDSDRICFQNESQQDYKTAVKCYRLAADLGNPEARYNLGTMYEAGNGVKQDYKAAVKWFKLAAEQGHVLAQFNLGTMYATGEGVEKSLEQAYFWFLIVVENDENEDELDDDVYELASENCDIVVLDLSASQKKRIQKEAAAWKPTL